MTIKNCPERPCKGRTCKFWDNCDAKKDGREGGKK